VSLASLVVASVIAASSGQQPVRRDDRSYAAIVSLDRVRAALDKPPSKLTLPEKQPDFSVDIRERKRFDQMVLPLLDVKVGPGFPQSALFTSPFGSQPLFSVDLMPVAVAAASAVNAARKAYAKHTAIQEVRARIAAYCAAQPRRGAGIQICDTF